MKAEMKAGLAGLVSGVVFTLLPTFLLAPKPEPLPAEQYVILVTPQGPIFGKAQEGLDVKAQLEELERYLKEQVEELKKEALKIDSKGNIVF